MAVDPSAAWADALKVRSYELDQAISQSQVLFFISTTPGFIPNNETGHKSWYDNNNIEENNSAAECDNHEACRKSGLLGMCCPTITGIDLGCCSVKTTAINGFNKNIEPSTELNAAACASHTSCQSLGSGACCPTLDGIYLDCCHT